MRHAEADFQVGVVRFLRMAGHFVFAVPNGGSRNLREAVNLKAQGVMAGVSDLMNSKTPMGKAAKVRHKENLRTMYGRMGTSTLFGINGRKQSNL